VGVGFRRLSLIGVGLALCAGLGACGSRSALDSGRAASGGSAGTAGAGGSGPGGAPTGGTSTGGSAGTVGGGGGLRVGLVCTPDLFCQVAPEVTANRLNAVWGSGPNDVWAVGDAGTIVHYDGTSWRSVVWQTNASLLGVSGTSERDVWFVGEGGVVLHYDGVDIDAARGPSTDLYLIAVHAIGKDDVWIASGSLRFPVEDLDYGAVFHFDGASWRDVRPAPGKLFYRALWANSSSDVWVTGDRTFRYRGTEWQPVGTAEGADLWGNSATGVWMPDRVSTDAVWHVDGVKSTKTFDGDASRKLQGIWGSSERDIWSVGSQGYIVHYDGSAWAAVPSGTQQNLNAVWGSSSRDVWAVGDIGMILHFDGSSWSIAIADRADERSHPFNAIWSASSERHWIASAAGIFEYDGGRQLRASGPDGGPGAASYRSIWGTAPDNVVAVGSVGAIAEFDGTRWTGPAKSTTSDDLSAVWGHSDKMLAVGRRTGIIRVGRGDWRVEPVTGGAGGPLSAIWGSSAEDIWVSSFISGVFGHYVGGRWEAVDTSVFAAALWGSARDDVWGVSNRSAARFDGMRWTGMPLPVEGATAITGCGTASPWVAGEGGVLLNYNGDKWYEMRSGTTNSLRGIHCSGEAVWIVGEGGIILRHLLARH
jgi:hypothetical protein